MELSQTPVARRSDMETSIYNEVIATLTSNWEQGLINRSDVVGYQRVISEGNFPSKSPVLVDPTKRALKDFLVYVDSQGVASRKVPGLNGMEGLSGFLGSIWKAVKKGVGAVVGLASKVIGGGGQAPIVVQPQINVPENIIKTQLSPGAAQAFGAGMFGGNTMPIMLAAVAVALIFIVKK